jgi:hypothetical protein
LSCTNHNHFDKGEVEMVENHELCSYFDNLPSRLTANILLPLPIKSLLVCRCVCKIWKTMISEPHFAKLHLERSPISLMIRTHGSDLVSRTLHLLECESKSLSLETIILLSLTLCSSFHSVMANYLRRKGMRSRINACTYFVLVWINR